ncbi:hypothetical protein N7524_004149 [Penicillium chrysogenum]|nr:hypothetical protein N7524_004149 [Penicillium chrysogenum]
MPRTTLRLKSVLDVLRSVYDPLLAAWLAGPGHTWQSQFLSSDASNLFRDQVIARMRDLPPGVQSIESEAVLYEILYDILRFYRFTDPAWRVPTPGTTAPAPPAPAPVPPAAPPAAAAPAPKAPSAAAMEVDIANLKMLADAANQVLAPTATADPAPSPARALARVRVPYLARARLAKIPGSRRTPGPRPTPRSRPRLAKTPIARPSARPRRRPVKTPSAAAMEVDIANLKMLADAANQVLAPTATAEPSPVVSPTSSLDILAAAASSLPYAPAPATAARPIGPPAPGTKRSREDGSEDESEQPDKKKQAK